MDNEKSTILNEVYKYYTNTSNYLNENLNEDGYCVTVDDQMFNDILDMINTGTYSETEPGHILIPTEGGYTLHITPNGGIYLDDERGNEMEVSIDQQKLNQIMNTIASRDYKQVSENRNNPFTNVEQDPESGFVKFTKKDNVSDGDAKKAMRTAVNKSKERHDAKRQETTPPSMKDKRNDPKYMGKVHGYWDKRRDNMAEPHGYGTSGTLSMFKESTDEADMYDPAADKPDTTVYPPKGLGINEARLAKIVSRIIKNKFR